jgi:hypothetical protein
MCQQIETKSQLFYENLGTEIVYGAGKLDERISSK